MPVRPIKREMPQDILHGDARPPYPSQMGAGYPGASSSLRQQLSGHCGPLPGQPPAKPLPPPIDETALDYSSVKGIFGWTTVDGVSLPYLFREGKEYVAVRMVELKLLFKYPNAYPEELKKRPPLMSHYITEAEGKLLNEINVEHCEMEFGRHQFTTKDLVVRLEEFKDFYNIVKDAFPDTENTGITEDDLSGGWMQVNNSVIPYVIRTSENLLPLPVVQYAAELLNGINTDAVALSPTDAECEYFNKHCKKAGLNFYFGKNTKLVRLTSLLQHSKPEVSELPQDNPFRAATFKMHAYRPSQRYQNGMNQRPPNDYMRTTMPGQNRNPRMYVGGQHAGARGPPPPYYPPPPGMITGMPRPQQPPVTRPSDPRPHNPVVSSSGRTPTATDASKTRSSTADPRSPPNVMIGQNSWMPMGANNTMLLPPQFMQGSPGTFPHVQLVNHNGQMVPVAMSTGATTGMIPHTAPSSIYSSAPLRRPVATTTTATSADQSKQTTTQSTKPNNPQTQKSSATSILRNAVSSMLQNSISPVEFHKKAVSCLNTNNSKWALIEAIGKLYFPYCKMEEFQYALESVLSCPVRALTGEEERAFIEFYGLPTNSLNCNKVVRLEDLEKYMTQLKYMFKDKEDAALEKMQAEAAKRKAPPTNNIGNDPKKRKRDSTTIVMNGDDVILID